MTDLKRNVPELRFPEFEDEWEEKKLGEIVSFGKGKLLGKKDLTEDGKYLCILYGELYTKYGAIINNIESRTNVDPSKLKKADKNQILIPSSGETVEDIATASALVVKEDVYIGGDLNILTPKKDDGTFISLSLNSVNRWNISKLAQGKTVVHLYNSDLKKLEIKMPKNIKEQQKIGDFFSKLDHQIELEEEKLALLEEQKKGYMQKIFSQELRFKDDNGEDYPAWEEKKLGDIGHVAMNKRIYKNETSTNGEIPFYKIGTFGKKAESFITREKFEDYKNKYPYPNKGDILISASGSIGRTIEYDGEEAYYQDSNIVWLEHNDEVLNVFLKYFYSVVKWFGVEGTTIKRLYNKNILNTKINLPLVDEQQKIGGFFSKLDRQIEIQSQKIDLLKQRKQGFLQKMFV
ncbi:restriction endonuclease subunit S [Staphylococcus delphini]|uniref:restriction endonuclease subunit S n=1 Tax=Staphylococcus delphini TaxID=53344 RepID=UPI0012D2E8DD|nr:restriction endonuclease subunit S [Staphylococcus delphini]MTV22395.1 restriction endonuclease subunit S [Staphylococcus delphini]